MDVAHFLCVCRWGFFFFFSLRSLVSQALSCFVTLPSPASFYLSCPFFFVSRHGCFYMGGRDTHTHSKRRSTPFCLSTPSPILVVYSFEKKGFLSTPSTDYPSLFHESKRQLCGDAPLSPASWRARPCTFVMHVAQASAVSRAVAAAVATATTQTAVTAARLTSTSQQLRRPPSQHRHCPLLRP